MRYSQIDKPLGIGRVFVKPNARADFQSGSKVCGYIKDDWFVWDCKTKELEAIFSSKPNVHGWLASKAHAKSYCICADDSWSPQELDLIS